VAIITDARLGGHTDLAQVVENLLSISGEDARTIDRKHLPSCTTRLHTRFVMISNEVPKLIDASGALATRFILLKLTEGFLHREDRELTTYLLRELPGILLWAIEGWKRLKDRGYFLQPKSGQDMVSLMEDLSSPVGAFVRDMCVIGPEHTIPIHDLFEAWKGWCVSKGREKSAGDEHTFGKNLRAAVPNLATTRLGPRTEKRPRHYQGIALALQDGSAGTPF
jgi:putative DNA primase/helicase